MHLLLLRRRCRTLTRWPDAGTLVYGIFLGFFLYHTLSSRDQAFYFTQYAREISDVDKFMQIDDAVKYRDWLEYRFLPGMHWNSVNRSVGGTPSVFLVGPPRVRAVRAKSAYRGKFEHNETEEDHPDNCGHAAEMDNMPVVCFDLSMSDPFHGNWNGSSTWFDRQAPWFDVAAAPSRATGVRMEYQNASTTREEEYSSYTGLSYPGDGHVVRDVFRLFERAPSVETAGNELFPWPHLRTDAQELFDAGLLHPTTRVIFHDYTIYSGTKDAYVNVRLVMEIGVDHGMFIPTRHVRIVWLTNWPEYKVAFEVLFFMMLLLLGLENIFFWIRQIWGAEEALEEALELARFQLRYQILQQAAFKSLFAYRPRVLMKQIEEKVRKVKSDRTHHIAALNKLGCRVTVLHESFQRLMNMDAEMRQAGDKPEHKAAAVLEVLKSTVDLKKRVLDLHSLKSKGKTGIRGCPTRARIRVANATLVYCADGWRVLDMFNYIFFFVTFLIRLRLNPLMTQAEEDIEAINRTTPYADDSYVLFYQATFWATLLTYAYAVNAVLTWLKVFKFLSYFPSMQILTRTLGYASGPLISFSIIFTVVLVGFGQSFFLAFGLDLVEYRTFPTSFFALLRMGVGDFDYNRLEQSHRTLGPGLFWMYIFLVFFILMSVFIALISEAYEKAKNELQNVEEAARQTLVIDDPVKTIEEARTTLRSVAPGLISKELLGSMRDALPKERMKRTQSRLEQLGMTCCGRKREQRRWEKGPLSEDQVGPWQDREGKRRPPVDIFDSHMMEWVNTNDLKEYSIFLAEQRQLKPGAPSEEIPNRRRKRILPGMLVCRISNTAAKGTVVKKEGNRACVDFSEGDAMRAGLASLTNLLGSESGKSSGLKAALSKAMNRAAEINKKHPTDWSVDEVVEWAQKFTDADGVPLLASVATQFAYHKVNGKCLLHLDRADLKDIGVEKVGDIKKTLVEISHLRKIPKQITLDTSHAKKPARGSTSAALLDALNEEDEEGSDNDGTAPLPSPLPGAVNGGPGPGAIKLDDVDKFIADEAANSSSNDGTVLKQLLNADSKWVKFSLGERAFYQNTGIKGLNSLKMPREGVKGERQIKRDDAIGRQKFETNYEKAGKMDGMKARARANTGAWGQLVAGQAPPGAQNPTAPTSRTVSGGPNANARALAEQIRAAEQADR